MSDVSTSSAPVESSESSASESPETRSAPSANGGSSSSNGIPSVESVTGGAVKSEKKEASDANAPAGETASEKAERKEAERRLKLKINGQEKEYSESEVIRKAQLAESADARFKEAAEMRKQVEQFMHTLKTDPKKVLLNPNLGINFRELAEEYLGSEIRKEMMDPVQRELEELRAWKAEQEESRQKAEESEKTTKQQQEFEQLKSRKAQEYDQKISKVLTEANLPKTAYTVKRVAEVLLNAQRKGYELDLETAVDFVKEGYMTDIQSMFGSLEGDQLFSVLGDGLAKKIRQHDLQKLKAKLQPGSQPAEIAKQAVERASKQPESKALSPDEWKEMIRRKAGV
jgi:hypothetical protein